MYALVYYSSFSDLLHPTLCSATSLECSFLRLSNNNIHLWASLVANVKVSAYSAETQETQTQFLGQNDLLEESMATESSILA